ncbi:CTB family bacteriocin [Cronbergia sp. UHCC 0137]|uniref:CTB family bacteriocin n=1 Tax=Cronbergia sp. UHCC 0137 TaxID=3110239 RepID=UPI002B216741|nr:CTB family bacteriocin [Cronbergia sp. UHCC 0137]MEA5618591.1 CTB family bacteriocin [Cronbergia sp. UHCC 0137]
MTNSNMSDLFVALSNEQQEFLTGGADFELAGSNYANRLASLQGTTASGPAGSTGNSIGTTSAVNTAAQDLLGLGVPSIPQVGALGSAPVLTGLAETPLTGGSPLGGFGGFGTPGF